MALLPILAISTMMSLAGGAMFYMSVQRNREIASEQMRKEGRLVKGAMLDEAAAALTGHIISGFRTTNPPNQTYWMVYPPQSTPAPGTVAITSGFVPEPGGALAAGQSIPQLTFQDMCNPAIMDATGFTNMLKLGSVPPACAPGQAGNCCYRVPSSVRLLFAKPAQYLELAASIDGALDQVSANLPGAVNPLTRAIARVTIPDLPSLPAPTCLMSMKAPVYTYVYWRQGVLNYNLHAYKPPDFDTPVSANEVYVDFVNGVNCEYTPGTVNGTASSCPSKMVIESTTNNNAAALQANTAAGVDINFQVPNTVPNVAHNYVMRGEVDGPGGMNICDATIQMQPLPVPTCTLSSAAVYWTPGNTCAPLTFDAPIPPSPAGWAPIPPAFLSSGAGTGAIWWTPVAVGSASPSSISDFSLGNHTRTINACAAIANPVANTNETFYGNVTGDAGTSATCSGTLTVVPVPPPTCDLQVAKAGDHANITVSAGSPSAPGLSRATYRPTSIVITSSDASYSNTITPNTDDYVSNPPLAAYPTAGHTSTFSITYYATVTGPSGSCVATPKTVTYTTPGCTVSANPTYVKQKEYGGYKTTLSVSTSGDVTSSSTQWDPSSPRSGGGSYSFDVTVGDCGANGGLPTSFTCTAYGPAGTGTGTATVSYHCGDRLGGYDFHDFCYTPSLPFGGGTPNTPTKSPSCGDNCGGFLGCWEAEFAVHNDPDCHWKHCRSIPQDGDPNGPPNDSYAMTSFQWYAYNPNYPPTTSWPPVTASNYVYWVDNGNENSWDDVTQDLNPRCINRSAGSCIPGCFDPETRIQMATGKFRAAGAIRTGDALWNPITQRPLIVKNLVVGPEKKKLIELGYDDKTVKVTQDHPVPTPRGIVQAMQLRKGDQILGADGAYHPIVTLRKLPVKKGQEVINFIFEEPGETSADHMLLSEGVVTGDWFVQTLLKKKPSRPLPPLD